MTLLQQQLDSLVRQHGVWAVKEIVDKLAEDQDDADQAEIASNRQRPCPLCGGDGYVSRDTIRMVRNYNLDDTTCPACHGE